MTEKQWLKAKDPDPLLEYLQGKISDRKLRLLGCGYCRNIWPLLIEEASRQAVEIAEQFADGEASDEERIAAFEEADFASEACRTTGEREYFAAVAAGELVEHEECEWYCGWYGLRSYLPPDKQIELVRCVVGNPFKPVAQKSAWLTRPVKQLAAGIYEERAFDKMPILADALEEAGCTSGGMLEHCRQDGDHVRGCWVLDLLLGKA
jgi:hypothetical protein